ncbi:Uncharacterised protein [uncultured archaeon]|nr:Uncharacterised protein [uncultured archaeon]
MKQQDAYKLLAAFMILIMIIVPVAYVITSPRSDSGSQTTGQQSQQDKYNSEFWIVDQPFYSISDALNMTPYGAVMADYVDLEGMTPQMMQWARQNLQIISEADSVYKSNSTKVYYSNLRYGKNDSFLLLSTMSPEKNDFEYITLPNTNNIPILIRQEQQLNGLYNIMGNPVILAPPRTAIDVLNIIYSQNKTTTAYDQYEVLLSNVEPAQFQIVNSNVSFATQFYMGIGTVNGTYERTTTYLNINPSNLTRLNRLETNSTQRGFAQYNITRSGNYTIVKIASPDLFNVVNEETS